MNLYLVKTYGCGELYAMANSISEAAQIVEDKLKDHAPIFDRDNKIIEIVLYAETKRAGNTGVYRPKFDLPGMTRK